jgi:hypothetical protein
VNGPIGAWTDRAEGEGRLVFQTTFFGDVEPLLLHLHLHLLLHRHRHLRWHRIARADASMLTDAVMGSCSVLRNFAPLPAVELLPSLRAGSSSFTPKARHSRPHCHAATRPATPIALGVRLFQGHACRPSPPWPLPGQARRQRRAVSPHNTST